MPAPPGSDNIQGVEDAAILLMAIGEEEAAEVFKFLVPKEVQRLGETIARMQAVPKERFENVLDKVSQLTEDEQRSAGVEPRSSGRPPPLQPSGRKMSNRWRA